MTTQHERQIPVSRFVLLLLTGLSLLAVSCGKRPAELPDVLSAPIGRLLPEGEALPARIAGARIVGNPSPEDRAQIAKLIGRIPDISHEIKSLEAFWDEYPLAARVRVDDYYVYCIKSRDKAWEISGSGSVVSDSTSGMLHTSSKGATNQHTQ